MIGQTIRLTNDTARYRAHRLIDAAPHGAVLNIRPANRTTDQNARFWAMLSDVSRSKPGGRTMTPERWKAAFMQSFGHAVQFETDLEGRPFPIGHSSSRLSKSEMGELMDFIEAWGTENGVVWSDRHDQAA
jgi:hypothetical protein